ncbi:hypothetical protein SLEP1_g27912 [Rubroshorea leprosula]|uniref:Uncharacterized protein n=1 Tax=Rubroshorea leprosula TaxID=152421 RepID=A0AAV5JUL1_9ROSI|nr:hypothetical protein SLEP1_g27912 [Rubroshorea leprosula]
MLDSCLQAPFSTFLGLCPKSPSCGVFEILNIDDSAIGNPREAGCGGLFRDSLDHWTIGYVHKIGIMTTFVAEL